MISNNSGPGYRTHPEHTLRLKRPGKRVQVTIWNDVIADSNEVIQLEEANYPPVYYFPRKHVKMDRLRKSATHTHCPFKGEASYFSLIGPSAVEDLGWSYEAPFDEVLGLRDHIAFYANKVDSIRSD